MRNKPLRNSAGILKGPSHPCTRQAYIPKEARRPITLRLPLIGYQPVEDLARQLLESGFSWWWCCWWKENLPWDYPLQRLTNRSIEQLAADFCREADMFLYFVDLYGFLPEVGEEIDHHFLASQLIAFYEGEPTFLQIYLARLDDEPEECTYINMPRERRWSDELRLLLKMWDIEADFRQFSVVKGEWRDLKGMVSLYRRLLERR